MARLEYHGAKGLPEKEQAQLNTLAIRYSEKFDRYYDNAVTKVTIRRHNTDGKRQKITVNVMLSAPNMIAKTKQADWEIRRAAHKAFQNMENELKKIRKLETQRMKKNNLRRK